jgi:hypothetical protein
MASREAAPALPVGRTSVGFWEGGCLSEGEAKLTGIVGVIRNVGGS